MHLLGNRLLLREAHSDITDTAIHRSQAKVDLLRKFVLFLNRIKFRESPPRHFFVDIDVFLAVCSRYETVSKGWVLIGGGDADDSVSIL